MTELTHSYKSACIVQVNFEQMQIQKQIGEGSFGKVYLAKWKETTVAVKILTNPNGSSDDNFPTRLPNPLLQSLEKVRKPCCLCLADVNARPCSLVLPSQGHDSDYGHLNARLTFPSTKGKHACPVRYVSVL